MNEDDSHKDELEHKIHSKRPQQPPPSPKKLRGERDGLGSHSSSCNKSHTRHASDRSPLSTKQWLTALVGHISQQ